MNSIEVTKYRAIDNRGEIRDSFDILVRDDRGVRKVSTNDAKRELSDMVEENRELIDFPVFLFPQRDGNIEVVSVPAFLLA